MTDEEKKFSSEENKCCGTCRWMCQSPNAKAYYKTNNTSPHGDVVIPKIKTISENLRSLMMVRDAVSGSVSQILIFGG